MQHTTGRHRRQHRTLAGQLCALATTALATALAFVFVPGTPTRTAIGPAPDRRELPTGSPGEPEPLAANPEPRPSDPDETGGALVRPYMYPRPQRRATIPQPRIPVGDLLAAEPPPQRGEFDELASLVRVYLATDGSPAT
ncbi:hypothetical protein KIK06_19600 [Nocardiopsis sp. EMB25]|uniref:hypothetical protein n=1 Tax=Nocardiopsis sp. EMB25 TaxID=2835867 RepID=UPI00228470E7|nr:hypothetical protein [Nocardiopsis sp. EMB25]MCY9786101.1 hypothetical protein [Nocardiopsis sp. EMB25]